MSKLENLKLDAAELYRLAELTERRRVKDILTIEAKKIETKISLSQEQENVERVVRKDTSVGKRTYEVKLNTYAWDQTDTSVKVYCTLDKMETLPADNIFCTFTETSFELRVNDLDGKNYVLPIKLNQSIKPETCSWKVKSGMVIITIPKAKVHTWPDLVWKKPSVVKESPAFDENADPSACILNVMQQMYEVGDDEMKQNIMKTWTEIREKNMNDKM